MPPAVPVARAWGHVELVLPSLMGGNGGEGCMKGCIRWTQSYAGMRAAHRLDTGKYGISVPVKLVYPLLFGRQCTRVPVYPPPLETSVPPQVFPVLN